MDGRRIPFTAEDESRIASAATWGTIVSVCSLVGGAISLITSLVAMGSLPSSFGFPGAGFIGIVSLVVVAITVMLNVWLLQASGAFRKVAATDEADQQYLLEGFRKLRLYFEVQVVLILIGLGFVLLMFVFMAACSP